MIRGASWHSSKRTAKDSGVLNPAETRSKRSGINIKPLLGGLASSLIGSARSGSAAGWACRMPSRSNGRNWPAHGARAEPARCGKRCVSCRAIPAVTERLMLVEALRGDGERRRDAEQRLLDLPGVVDAHLNVRGRAVPDTSRRDR